MRGMMRVMMRMMKTRNAARGWQWRRVMKRKGGRRLNVIGTVKLRREQSGDFCNVRMEADDRQEEGEVLWWWDRRWWGVEKTWEQGKMNWWAHEAERGERHLNEFLSEKWSTVATKMERMSKCKPWDFLSNRNIDWGICRVLLMPIKWTALYSCCISQDEIWNVMSQYNVFCSCSSGNCEWEDEDEEDQDYSITFLTPSKFSSVTRIHFSNIIFLLLSSQGQEWKRNTFFSVWGANKSETSSVSFCGIGRCYLHPLIYFWEVSAQLQRLLSMKWNQGEWDLALYRLISPLVWTNNQFISEQVSLSEGYGNKTKRKGSIGDKYFYQICSLFQFRKLKNHETWKKANV